MIALSRPEADSVYKLPCPFVQNCIFFYLELAKVFCTYNSSHTSIYKAESDGDIEGYAAVKCMALSALVLIAVHYSALHCSEVLFNAVQFFAAHCSAV